MDYGPFNYEEPYPRPRRRINYFAWTMAILLLTGLTFAAWLGSFYIFDQPERPDSYRILQRLHKIDPPKRFELTAAPAGEFVNAKQLYDRYIAMGAAELAKANAELVRNYIRNYTQVRGLVPYVTGRFIMMEARELGPNDVFTSGIVALTNSVDHGELLMEHVYPADSDVVPLMKQTLSVGLEIKLERTHDLSAVIHAARLTDGRIMITAIPLLYGTYTITRGPGTFTLEPPLDLNLAAGWPLFKEEMRANAELRYVNFRRQAAGPQGQVPIIGVPPSGTPPPAQNALVRVEHAQPVETPQVAVATPPPKLEKGKASPAGKNAKLAKNRKSPSPTATPPQVASSKTPGATASPPQKFAAAPPPATGPSPQIALTPPSGNAIPAAQPLLGDGSALASTAGGGNWKTYPPG